MPTKTIYVREADAELWEKAEELSGGSVSALIAERLRRFVEEEELKEKTGMETIEVSLWTPNEEPYFAQFVGRWLLVPDPDETRTGEPGGYDAGAYYGVALTRRGKFAVYIRHVNNLFAPTLEVYDSLEEAQAAGQPKDILTLAAANVGVGFTYQLDI